MEKKRILVVDDEEDLREILQFNLENEGYIVDTAESAKQALKTLTKEHELILLDVMMTGISGFKMAERLRKELHNTTPIIFLTAKDTENDMLTGFSIGGDDYIAKPFSIKEVCARVKAVLKRVATTPEQQQIEVGEILINTITKQVFVNKQSIPLTKKEFEILYMLAKAPGRIFSREAILRNVWADDGYVLERTVDVHITRLRKKLGEQGHYIINRSGYGYCIEL
ncbi:response regulator transcription factor [uncultured Sanguibacteroides sp.]|uniref:response regulator transcription factor n=1 Tax=uncultured Sanguibacteroides sp. TaxID=1635151 RepID=UPI0025F78AED|nr:response regulator transcription factor [uncultured Sanguibacteroides sp.]